MAKAKRPSNEAAWDEQTLRCEIPVPTSEEERPSAEVDIEIHDPRPKSDKTWAEVWTQHRIYLLDETRRCFAVKDRASGKRTSTHKLVGFKLIGGRTKAASGKWRVVYPWPEAGMEAIMASGDHLAVTSPTERAIILVRKYDMLSDATADTLLRELAKASV